MSPNNTEVANRILYEDNHLIAVNKLAGELVQGDRTNDITLADTIKEHIKQQANKPGNVFLGIPHRIDRPVSGVVIYAKTSKGLSRMSELFRTKEIHKTYWAIVENKPKETQAKLRHYMIKNEKQNKSHVSDIEKPNHKEAILSYHLIASSDRYFLLEVNLETGRHHQIRAQLAHIGCPIKGELKSGASRSNADGSISLHSRLMTFHHPIKDTDVIIEAPCPNDKLWHFFETLNRKT